MANIDFSNWALNNRKLINFFIICLVIGALLWKPMGRYLRGEDLGNR